MNQPAAETIRAGRFLTVRARNDGQTERAAIRHCERPQPKGRLIVSARSNPVHLTHVNMQVGLTSTCK